jgi:hypothetical protein
LLLSFRSYANLAFLCDKVSLSQGEGRFGNAKTG